MITGEHAVIRTAEPDDAYQLKRLYDPSQPRAALLDGKRELNQPTVDELRQVLGQKDVKAALFYVIEDRAGMIRGFCTLRGDGNPAFYGEILLMMFDDCDYAGPMAGEVLAYLTKCAFVDKRLNKVLAHCLAHEGALRDFLLSTGFKSDGIQREVLYTLGGWHNLETFTLFREGPKGDRHGA